MSVQAPSISTKESLQNTINPLEEKPSFISKLFSKIWSPTQKPLLKIASAEDFASALAREDFLFLRSELKQFFQKLEPEQQDTYLRTATLKGFETHNEKLLKRCLELLSFEEMQALLNHAHSQIDAFKAVIQRRKDFYTFLPEKTHIPSPSFKGDLKNALPFVFTFLISFVNTLVYSTNLLELGKHPESAWDANFQLQIYYQILAIPVAIFFGLQQFITHPVLVTAAFTTAIIGLFTSLYAYLHWLQPAPIKLPFADNLTLQVKKNVLNSIVGRDREIQQILQILEERSVKIRKHPLIIGDSGVGKNELINGLAHELMHNTSGKVPKELQDMQVFLINTASLLGTTVKLTNPIDDLKKSIGMHGKKMILVFNEAQALDEDPQLKELMKTLLDSSSGLPYCIFITSTDKQEKLGDQTLTTRFERISIKELDNDQVLKIGRNFIQSESPETDFTSEELETILTESTADTNLPQPTPILRLLSSKLAEIKRFLDGHELKTAINIVDEEIANLKAKIPHKATGAILLELENLFSEIKAKEKEKKSKLEALKNFKAMISTYRALHDRGRLIEEAIPKLIERIENPGWKELGIGDLVKRQYLFTEFFLLPAKESAIHKFVSEKDLHIKLR